MTDVAPANAPVQIKPKSRPPLVVEYGGPTYTLTGRIPSEIMTIQAQSKAPRNPAKDAQDAYKREVGIAVIDKFYDLVVPDDFKAVLDMEDLAPVFEAWSGHVGLGESKDSGN
ncbi:hypothetical protein [Frigoribacterium faeni]|uniref:Uncharacterized protein n=1 Tax=Frigoribacterium faeni TaxID=145483 RepID=A0A7W3PI88_9MICO|nr:hypothetical protein [Frigoribacterium faeni]MBA8812666.1 hypothetical protein [Frigoribacterium faeni]BFF13776.1 hypothetical protein GCM10025699_50790 [Microbacterium flavescens]GEK82321.1 hypothetical protein FFA01_06300 [Frigoribacterium faeni]